MSCDTSYVVGTIQLCVEFSALLMGNLLACNARSASIVLPLLLPWLFLLLSLCNVDLLWPQTGYLGSYYT